MDRSQQLYGESSKLSPGGVSSPVRAFKPYPLFIQSGQGCTMTDADGRTYIDMCMARLQHAAQRRQHRHPAASCQKECIAA